MMTENTLGQLFKDGEVIVKQGTVGNCIYIIQKGRVAVIEESGDKETKVAELGKSDFFGEMAVFEKTLRSCTIRAIGDVKVLSLDKRNFYKTIQNDPSLAFRLLENMSNRIRRMNKKVV